MAMADYCGCARCGGKTFYDSNLDFEDEEEGTARPDDLPRGAWDMAVLCRKCAETHEVEVQEKAPSKLRVPAEEAEQAMIRALEAHEPKLSAEMLKAVDAATVMTVESDEVPFGELWAEALGVLIGLGRYARRRLDEKK